MSLKKLFYLFLFLFLLEISLQCEEKRFEIELYGNMNLPDFKGSYFYNYSPPFSPGSFISTSDLFISYRAKSKNGFGAGINYFPMKNIGIRFESNFFRTSLEGESSKYNIYMEYVSMQPPSYLPRLFIYRANIDWEPADGDFKRFNTNLNFIYRKNLGKRISADILIGFSYEISKLDLKSIGYTKFWLGGHSVLFMETYKIGFSSGSIKDFGLASGGIINFPLGNKFDLSFGFRYFYFPLRFTSIELTEQTNRNETISQLEEDELELIKKRMKLPLIEFSCSYYSLRASLKFKF